MPLVYHTYFQRGLATSIRFALESPLATSSDRFATFTAATFAAGDVVISKDGGAIASTTNLPTQVTASYPLYELDLTSTEMDCIQADVFIVDVTAGAVWRDCHVQMQSTLFLGKLDVSNSAGDAISAVSTGSNGSGLKATGQGSGDGIKATAGATGIGIDGIGGATSGAGLAATATAGNSHGFTATGSGTGAGARWVAGATGHGASFLGGATSGHGLDSQGNGSGRGAFFQGTGTSAAINALGGSGGGIGFEVTGGSGAAGMAIAGGANATALSIVANTTGRGIQVTAAGTSTGIDVSAGNGDGVTLAGGPTSGGLTCTGGTGGIRGVGSTNGHGIQGVGAGTGNGLHGQFTGTGRIMNFFLDLEGAEPTTMPDNATVLQIFQGVKRFLFGKVTQTSTLRTIERDDRTTDFVTMTVSNDGTTQVKEKVGF